MGTIRVSCWSGADKGAATGPKGVVSNAATSGANSLSGALPSGTEVLSVYAVEAHYFAFDGTAAPDATSNTARVFVPAGAERDIRLMAPTKGTEKFAAILG